MQTETATPPVRKSGLSRLRTIGSLLGKFFVQFLLPVIALGPLLIGAEKGAEYLGFHGTNSQFLRMLMLGVYGLIFFTMASRSRRKQAETDPTTDDQNPADVPGDI